MIVSRAWMRAGAQNLRALLPILVGLSLAGPALAQSGSSPKSAPLARPDRILVYDFAATADQVQLDKGIASRVRRAVRDEKSQADAETAAEAQKVVAAIGTTLVAELGKLGIPASRADAATMVADSDKVLVVRGQILSIDQGNRTRRTIIGLGAGRSQVQASSQLYYQSPGASALQFLTRAEAKGESGRMPGLAVGAGVGAAAGRAATTAAVGAGAKGASEISRTSVEADGERLAKQLARSYAQYFARQGWIPASAVPR